jgi:uncharacterized protein YjbJ (UPF0337 family)
VVLDSPGPLPEVDVRTGPAERDDVDALRSSWPDSRARVQRKWSRLTEDDLGSIDGNSQHLVSRLQERYGYPRDRAERECQELLDEIDLAARRTAAGPDATKMPSGNARAPGSPAPQSGTSRTSHRPEPEPEEGHRSQGGEG